ncbi:MAG TPA: glutamic-type intramembrane protease PrsW [Bacillales bacterium]|nr:glutamic-type intramembrane protease PrsW [Bacillales bacterium]
MVSMVAAAIAPGFALLCFFYLKDRYESEPISMVLRTFLFGALLVFPVMFIQYAFQFEGILQAPFVKAFVLSGTLEEFLKWFILYYTAYQHVEFNERYDGIVYGVAVSLGFATAENFFYLYAYGIDEAFWRALLPVSSHALFGVIMGYYLGKAKFFTTASRQRRFVWISLLAAVLLHGVYDYILFVYEHWVSVMIPFMLYLWWSSLRKVKLAHRDQRPANDAGIM